ncbi:MULTISPECIES: dipeptidyl-peptidase 3 family protein [Phenylobacterium]|uniref:DNA mismatch repair protein MutT n=1 Tax=Phenylobacterium koreense TaxID=266125 RepID=A0ABV2EDQ8_9CAUL
MRRIIAPLVAALCLPTAVMAATPMPDEGLARIQMQVETDFLSPEERQVVNLLIKAADEMTAIYRRQSAGEGPGHGFYPAGLTRAELDAYIAAHPDQKAALMDGYTVVKRQGDRLVTVPYNVEYKAELDRAAALLDQAAIVTSNASLKKFLTLRAKAFRNNDYFESEMAWMDLEGAPIEVAIGPYETYTDELYGQKTAFEAFVTLKDPQESAALDKYKGYLRAMEENLPVDARYKNFQRGGASPIAVAEQVRGGGDNTVGPQTIAFNLPNDERVREAKGAKKVILSNVLGAKYEEILKPMGDRVLVADQAALVSKKYMTLETLFHELSHSLGPGSITVNGRPTTVSAELKDIGGTAEEAKADVMGVYNIVFMMEKGELPKAERSQLLATYAAGIFRAVRWGAGEAHGRGAALQYGYLKSKGALTWDAAAKRYRVNDDAMQAGLTALVADLVKLQGDGDYAGMNAFFDRYAKLDPEAESVIATLKDIPVDIAPVYPDKI